MSLLQSQAQEALNTMAKSSNKTNSKYPASRRQPLQRGKAADTQGRSTTREQVLPPFALIKDYANVAANQVADSMELLGRMVDRDGLRRFTAEIADAAFRKGIGWLYEQLEDRNIANYLKRELELAGCEPPYPIPQDTIGEEYSLTEEEIEAVSNAFVDPPIDSNSFCPLQEAGGSGISENYRAVLEREGLAMEIRDDLEGEGMRLHVSDIECVITALKRRCLTMEERAERVINVLEAGLNPSGNDISSSELQEAIEVIKEMKGRINENKG